MRVLIVEDDDAIAEPLERGLRREGLEPVLCRTGAAALARLETGPVDLVLLDLGLPDLDGMEVCRRIRRTSEVPIIVITARGEELDRVMGLELGADDYVVKPFGFRELVARIRAVARRTGGGAAEPTTTTVGDLVIDRRTRKVTVAGEPVELTRKEFDLLAFLATDPGATFGRMQILESVWDEHWYGTSKTLDVHVASLRRKLGRPEAVETVRGVGYRLAAGSAS